MCKERGCLCVHCKYLEDCTGALCWDCCSDGRHCVKECNKYKKKLLDKREERVYNKIIKHMKEEEKRIYEQSDEDRV